MTKDFMLIGVDGGATKVSAWEISFDGSSKTFSLGKNNASRSYREQDDFMPNFKSVDLNTQLNEFVNEINPTPEEQQQANVYIETCAQAIKDLVSLTENTKVLIGIGMPGLKTADKRGIAVLANGPRMVNYSDQLEARLVQFDIDLVSPIAHLGSDADYCGIGENYAEDGIFRAAETAYYLGGGTGVADALKINGQLVTFDSAKSWIAKTWEMKDKDGYSMEMVTSVGGIQKLYAKISGKSIEELNEESVYPQQVSEQVLYGESDAIRTFDIVNRSIANLLYERIVTINQGWQNTFDFVNPDKSLLDTNHPYLNMVFDKIVIGQRLGDLFSSESGVSVVKKPVLKLLDDLIQKSPYLPVAVKNHYRNLEDILESSKLREAPALGAGIDAYFNKE